jgi:N-formylglutamate amidohydrolase
MLAALRLPVDALLALEDRYVDRLAHAARGEEILFVQRPARAWIDLNRDERERDAKLDDGADPRTNPVESHKLRSGLGLVPRQMAQGGDIWRRRLTGAEVEARINADHRPYHAALAQALITARARFGIAVLLDIHSMPPLGAPEEAARIVFGDRFGRAAATRLVSRAEAVIDSFGWRHALNTPYSGGHILDRHARPEAGIHAIQIEFDRSLYLDERLDQPGPGLAATASVLRAMIAAVADEALTSPGAIAAE